MAKKPIKPKNNKTVTKKVGGKVVSKTSSFDPAFKAKADSISKNLNSFYSSHADELTEALYGKKKKKP